MSAFRWQDVVRQKRSKKRQLKMNLFSFILIPHGKFSTPFGAEHSQEAKSSEQKGDKHLGSFHVILICSTKKAYILSFFCLRSYCEK